MSSYQTIPRDSLVATLQRERQAIFGMDASCTEKDRLWSQRTAELEAFLAADRVSHPSYNATTASLERTTSHNSTERKRSFQPGCRSQHVEAAGFNISPQTAVPTVDMQPIRCSRSASNPSVKPLSMTITHNSFAPTMSTGLQHSAADAKRADQDIVFDPGEYIAYKQSTDLIVPIAKRQRLDGIDTTTVPSLPASLMADQLGSSTSPMMLTPISSVSPGLSASSYHLSPYSSNASSFYGGEDMSRQSSSLSSTSMTDEFGMLRVESSGLSSLGDSLTSSFNEQQNEFPLLSDSVVSSMTEKPGSSSCVRATPGLDKTNFLQGELMRDMGSGFATNGLSSTFSSIPDSTSTSDSAGYGMPWQMNLVGEEGSDLTEMQRTGSQVSASTNSSASNTASQDKAAARRLKHIANGASQPLRPRALALSDKPDVKPIVNQKQLISRLPSQPKTKNPLTCHTCKIPLRGPHELTRHWDNVHAPVKKVWVIVEPKSSPFKPKKGLAICKQCKNHKQYNVYYNAAAHLKRVHFCPSKRGRRPRGEPAPVSSSQEKGSSPSIDQLKAHGWLQEIKVFNQGPGTVVDSVDDGTGEYDADNDDANAGQGSFDQHATLVSQLGAQNALCSSTSSLDLATSHSQPIDPQQEAICMQTLGLQPMPFSFGDDSLNGYASNTWSMAKAPMAAPMMEHSLSAPGSMGW